MDSQKYRESFGGVQPAIKFDRHTSNPLLQGQHPDEVVSCPGCRQRLKVPASVRPIRVRCKRCGREFDFGVPNA